MESRELVPDAFSAVQRLRQQLGRWSAAPPVEEAAVFSSGVAALDRILPGGGLQHGMLVEWLGEESGRAAEQQSRRTAEQKNGRAGEQRSWSYSATPPLHYSTPVLLHCGSSSTVTLSLLAAREACRAGGELVVIDRWQTFYPPAAAAWGIDLARLIVVRPRNVRDELWAAVQALRSPAVAAMWAAIDRLDSRAFRRLQLAAQAGRTLGLLLRPSSARGEPSWADVRIEGRGVRGEESRESRVEGRVPDQWGGRKGERGRQKGESYPFLRLPPSAFPLCSPLDSRPSTLRQVQVRVLHCHGGRPGGTAVLEIDDATHTVSRQSSVDSRQPSVVSCQSLVES